MGRGCAYLLCSAVEPFDLFAFGLTSSDVNAHSLAASVRKRTHLHVLGPVRVNLPRVEELAEVSETELFTEIGVELAVVSSL